MEKDNSQELQSKIENALDKNDKKTLLSLFSLNSIGYAVSCVEQLSFQHSVKALIFLSDTLHDCVTQSLDLPISQLTESDTHEQTLSISGICAWSRILLTIKGNDFKQCIEAQPALTQIQSDLNDISESYKKILQLKGRLDLLMGKMQIASI